jgi:hypothetical protein
MIACTNGAQDDRFVVFSSVELLMPHRTTTSTKGICSARAVTQTNLLAIACQRDMPHGSAGIIGHSGDRHGA